MRLFSSLRKIFLRWSYHWSQNTGKRHVWRLMFHIWICSKLCTVYYVIIIGSILGSIFQSDIFVWRNKKPCYFLQYTPIKAIKLMHFNDVSTRREFYGLSIDLTSLIFITIIQKHNMYLPVNMSCDLNTHSGCFTLFKLFVEFIIDFDHVTKLEIM